MDEFIEKIDSLATCIKIGPNTKISIMAFVDDLVLLSE
jgi:hypothetical protein